MARRVILGLALAFVAVLGVLTVRVVLISGPDVLVLCAVVVLALIAVGVVGALVTPDEE